MDDVTALVCTAALAEVLRNPAWSSLIIQFLCTLRGWERTLWPPHCVDLHPSFSVSCYISLSASLSLVFPSGVGWLALNVWAECQFDAHTQQGHRTALGPNELAGMIMQSLGKPLNPCSRKCAAQHTVRAMDMFEPVRHQNCSCLSDHQLTLTWKH